jgi:hypothetical protein
MALFWFQCGLAFVHIVSAGLLMFLSTTLATSIVFYSHDTVHTEISNADISKMPVWILMAGAVTHAFTAGSGDRLWPRWLCSILTDTLMNLFVALLFGVQDVTLLGAIYALTAVMVYGGFACERFACPHEQRADISILAFFCFAAYWGIVGAHFWRTDDPAPYLYATFFVYLFLRGVELGYQSLAYEEPHAREVAYGWLSLLTTHTLAWVAYGGTRD